VTQTDPSCYTFGTSVGASAPPPPPGNPAHMYSYITL
jgi:hypothetical protein